MSTPGQQSREVIVIDEEQPVQDNQQPHDGQEAMQTENYDAPDQQENIAPETQEAEPQQEPQAEQDAVPMQDEVIVVESTITETEVVQEIVVEAETGGLENQPEENKENKEEKEEKEDEKEQPFGVAALLKQMGEQKKNQPVKNSTSPDSSSSSSSSNASSTSTTTNTSNISKPPPKLFPSNLPKKIIPLNPQYVPLADDQSTVEQQKVAAIEFSKFIQNSKKRPYALTELGDFAGRFLATPEYVGYKYTSPQLLNILRNPEIQKHLRESGAILSGIKFNKAIYHVPLTKVKVVNGKKKQMKKN